MKRMLPGEGEENVTGGEDVTGGGGGVEDVIRG